LPSICHPSSICHPFVHVSSFVHQYLLPSPKWAVFYGFLVPSPAGSFRSCSGSGPPQFSTSSGVSSETSVAGLPGAAAAAAGAAALPAVAMASPPGHPSPPRHPGPVARVFEAKLAENRNLLDMQKSHLVYSSHI
jgi:hypothetical protein